MDLLEGTLEVFPEPKREALIECDTRSANWAPRTYHVKRLDTPVYRYNSKISGGQTHYTTEKKGPNGEPTFPERYEWVMTESDSYICHQPSWIMVLEFLQLVGAVNTVMLCDDELD